MAEAKEEYQLWGGRFKGGEGKDEARKKMQAQMDELNKSIGIDKRLWKADLAGSCVYVEGLRELGIVSQEEMEKIQTGLQNIAEEWKNGEFVIKPKDEDIHTAHERRLAEMISPSIAGKLHTARSRNEQVTLDMKLYMKEECLEIQKMLGALLYKVIEKAQEWMDMKIIAPAYTHLQPAQAVLLSHWILSHAFPIGWCFW